MSKSTPGWHHDKSSPISGSAAGANPRRPAQANSHFPQTGLAAARPPAPCSYRRRCRLRTVSWSPIHVVCPPRRRARRARARPGPLRLWQLRRRPLPRLAPSDPSHRRCSLAGGRAAQVKHLAAETRVLAFEPPRASIPALPPHSVRPPTICTGPSSSWLPPAGPVASPDDLRQRTLSITLSPPENPRSVSELNRA